MRPKIDFKVGENIWLKANTIFTVLFELNICKSISEQLGINTDYITANKCASKVVHRGKTSFSRETRFAIIEATILLRYF